MRNYIELIVNDSLTTKQKSRINKPGLAGFTWNPTNSVLNSLLYTGAVNNLENDSLKYLLFGWNDLVDDYKEQEQLYLNISIPSVRKYEGSRIPEPILGGEYSSINFRKTQMHKTDVSIYRERIVDELEYQNILINTSNSLFIQLITFVNAKESSDIIQDLIERETKSKKLEQFDKE